MFTRATLGTYLGIGLVAEILLFAAVAERIGLGSAIALSLLFSLLGALMLRRSGLAALASLRRLAEDGRPREGAFIDGIMAAVGALLLIVPGFLTDLCGLLLLAPSGRQWIARYLGLPAASAPSRPVAGGRPHTIDLSQGDFTRIDTPRGG